MVTDTPQSLDEARRLSARCTRCDLYRNATQTVFGEGPASAPVMLVGEQPGDKEDLAGHPFVGPAGRLLDAMLVQAGIDRSKCFVTNAVKHFKNVPRGKLRLHKRPDAGEVEACRWWLDIERQLVKPRLLAALGATAALALTGNGRGILKRRGRFETVDGVPVLITVHPSSLLRIPEAAAAATARRQFAADLAHLADRLPEIAL